MTRAARVAGAIVAVLVALGLQACGDDNRVGAPPSDNDPAVGTEPPGQDFFFDPATFVGEEITTTGYVSEVVNPVSFRIAGERIEGPGVLVVSDERVEVNENDLVQVKGTVRFFDVEVFTRDLDVTLDPVTFHAFEGSIAVAADGVTVNGVRTDTSAASAAEPALAAEK